MGDDYIEINRLELPETLLVTLAKPSTESELSKKQSFFCRQSYIHVFIAMLLLQIII